MKKSLSFIFLAASLAVMAGILSNCTGRKAVVTPEEARVIAKEAFIYGFPMVDNYRIMHAYFIDRSNPEYKCPFNQIKNIPKVYTPEDKAIQTPNSDTPYSMVGMDLRTEPLVFTIPVIEKSRYYSVQLIDLFTFNFDYAGSRTTGNDGIVFMVTGPGWNGEVPAGINKVFRSETELAMAAYRTQLFDSQDIVNVEKIQQEYKVQTLSEFLGQPAPAAAPAIDYPVPLPEQEEKKSIAFFDELSFLLQFCPVDSSETELRARFEKIGIVPGQKFDTAALSPEIRTAIAEGIEDAWKELKEFETTSLNTGKVTSGELFGTRAFLKNNYLYRFAAAVLGIYGNSKEEAMYPIYKIDAAGQLLDGTANKYIIRLSDNSLPPVNAFWSFTMYELPSSLLVANPINRYLINSPMLPNLKKDQNGEITLYIQNESPGKEKESNWLPAPKGPFMVVLRMYWPKEAALDGSWKQPPLELVK